MPPFGKKSWDICSAESQLLSGNLMANLAFPRYKYFTIPFWCTFDQLIIWHYHWKNYEALSYKTKTMYYIYQQEYICGSDGQTYTNICQLRRKACKEGDLVEIMRGPCMEKTTAEKTTSEKTTTKPTTTASQYSYWIVTVIYCILSILSAHSGTKCQCYLRYKLLNSVQLFILEYNFSSK